MRKSVLGVWLVLVCTVACVAWAQEAPEPPPEAPGEAPVEQEEGDSPKELYEEGKTRESEGDYAGAFAVYSLLIQEHPDSEWAALARERVIVLAERMERGPSGGRVLLSFILSILSLLFWLAIMVAVFGFFGYRAGWFWEWALLASVVDRVQGAIARFKSRKKLAHELQARKANPRDFRARHSLGVIYFQQRRYDLALTELEEAVALDPDRVDAQYHLGLTYLKLNRAADAVAPLEKVVAAKPQHGGDAMVRLAEAKLAVGQAEEAEPLCREAIEKTRSDPESRYFLARALDAQGKPDEVPGLLEEAIRLGRAYRGTRRRDATAIARKAKAYLRSWGA
jgi:tetratricopeptide (TPR) repeat protein